MNLDSERQAFEAAYDGKELHDAGSSNGWLGSAFYGWRLARAALQAPQEQDAVAFLLVDQRCRAPDDCEDYERLELARDMSLEELQKFQVADRCMPLYAAPPSPPARMPENTMSEMTLEEEKILRAELAQLRELKFCEPPGLALPTDAQIRATFLANGFTIKEGQADLKPYVFEAAHALVDLVRCGPIAPLTEQEPVSAPPIVAWLVDSYDRLDKLHQSVHLSPLTDDVTLTEADEAHPLCKCEDAIQYYRAAPPSAEPLTDDQIIAIAREHLDVYFDNFLAHELVAYTRAIIAQSRGRV